MTQKEMVDGMVKAVKQKASNEGLSQLDVLRWCKEKMDEQRHVLNVYEAETIHKLKKASSNSEHKAIYSEREPRKESLAKACSIAEDVFRKIESAYRRSKRRAV